jgi:hypothetical protein
MKCARCLWNHRDPDATGQYSRDAITVYGGNALCGIHLMQVKEDKREAREDPWTA